MQLRYLHYFFEEDWEGILLNFSLNTEEYSACVSSECHFPQLVVTD